MVVGSNLPADNELNISTPYTVFSPINGHGCCKKNCRLIVGVRLLESFGKWRRGVAVITTAQLHSKKPELRFCTGSNPARGVSEIRDGEDL